MMKEQRPGLNNVSNANLSETDSNLLALLIDATTRLGDFMGTDCECDNTHAANNTECCLCQYRKAIVKAQENRLCL